MSLSIGIGLPLERIVVNDDVLNPIPDDAIGEDDGGIGEDEFIGEE